MAGADEISVSRDALRADLAETELRLRIYFDEQLSHKASTSALTSLSDRVRELEVHGSRHAVEAINATDQLELAVGRLHARVAWATGAITAMVLAVNVGLHFFT